MKRWVRGYRYLLLWWPEPNLRDPHIRREPTPLSCPLNSPHTLSWHTCSHTYICKQMWKQEANTLCRTLISQFILAPEHTHPPRQINKHSQREMWIQPREDDKRGAIRNYAVSKNQGKLDASLVEARRDVKVPAQNLKKQRFVNTFRLLAPGAVPVTFFICLNHPACSSSLQSQKCNKAFFQGWQTTVF